MLKPISARRSAWLAGLFWIVLIGVYSPAVRGGFLWDDDAYISRNANLETLEGLKNIWLEPGSEQQYYPLTFTVFWLEHHLWGLHSTGYHLVNILIHGLNALLLGLLLEQLGLPGAWAAAWLFALHPVQVESVAWMTELKNVLSTFFYLLTVHVLLRVREERRRWPPLYALALIFFLCAILSKSVAVSLPVAWILITAWLKGSWEKKSILQMLPLVGLGLAVGLYTLYFEQVLVGAKGTAWHYAPSLRLMIAGRAFWFYLWKLLHPAPLTFIYPRWAMNPGDLFYLVYPLLAVAFLALLAYGKRWWGKIPFAGAIFFVLSLSPMLGLTSFYFMRYSFVADHFMYLANLGAFAVAGWAIMKGLDALHVPSSSLLGKGVIALILLNLAVSSALACRKYQDSRMLWEDTLVKNPGSAFVHHNLGIALCGDREWKEGYAHLRVAESLDPSFPQTHLALAYFFTQMKRWDEARREYEEAFRLGIHDPDISKDYAALPQSPASGRLR